LARVNYNYEKRQKELAKKKKKEEKRLKKLYKKPDVYENGSESEEPDSDIVSEDNETCEDTTETSETREE